jgi:hypothetical protein
VAVTDQRQLADEVVALCSRAAGAPSLWSSKVASDWQQLYQVHLWLLDVKHSSGLASALSPAQLQQCKAAWEDGMEQKAQKSRSGFEQEVYQCCAQQLPSLLTDCRQEARTEDGAFSTDVAATHTASGKLGGSGMI